MKVRVIKKTKQQVEFVLEGATLSFANALRRAMIGEVPVLAVEWVEFKENDSALFDEIVAHRLGMIPLVFDQKKFNFADDCKCEGAGCPLCQVVFVIDKEGPAMVKSGDMKTSNKDVKATSPDFPVVELLADQRLHCEAIAMLGRGKKHAKYQAANAAYSYDAAAKERSFRFTVETISGLEAGDIIEQAAEIIQEKADEFRKELAKA